MHDRMASPTLAAPSAPSLRVFANGDKRARWQTSFGETSADARDHSLIAQEAVHPHRVGGEELRQLVVGDRGRLWTEAFERRQLHHVGRRNTPHPGAPFLSLLGQQQRRLVEGAIGPLDRVEREPCLPSPGFVAELVVGEQPATLHQVHHECRRFEPHEEVLAPPSDLEQRMSVRAVRRGHRRLQRREVERGERRECSPRETLGQPLGVRLDLGHLRHGDGNLTRRSFDRAPSRMRRREPRTPAAIRAAAAGRRTAGSCRR